MMYILKYEIPSKYLPFHKEVYKEFVNLKELKNFLIDNVDFIHVYSIYKLSDLTGK